MLKRHEDQLYARLDELYLNRTTFISWREMQHWYNVERITKTLWRDIQARWRELLEGKRENYFDPATDVHDSGVALFFLRKPGKLSESAE